MSTENRDLLAGKTAIVTGGGRGIGRATALALARAGANVVVAARTARQVEAAAAEIEDLGRQALAVTVDVSDPEAVDRMVDAAVQAFDKVDILVNNAGIIKPIDWVVETDVGAWRYNIAVNLTSVFLCSRAVLPGMMARESGTIINVSTGSAVSVVPTWSAYAAAKAGVDHLTRVMAAEARPYRIQVNAVYPGLVDTKLAEKIRISPVTEAVAAETTGRFLSYQAGKGMLRSPDEPAQLILWLASPLSDDTTGQIVNIDVPEVQARVEGDLGRSISGRSRDESSEQADQ
jgi:NAD(P)-dependent dehydrogenase (short-subunit alcohol dehydrogenase family)